MTTKIGWTWPRGTALAYCFKVAVAAMAGYLLSIGDSTYSMYGAFTAALVVGTSRGEDVGSAANRVWGSLAGMVVGIVASNLAPHPGIAVAFGIGATAYICMGCGWGQAAARIGSSLCAVMILAHAQDAAEYSTMRLINTMIGIGAGLAVSYFVLPVRGRDLMEGNIRRALDAVARLLSAVSRSDIPVEGSHYAAVFDALVALNKTLVDAAHEIGAEYDSLRQTARHVALVCVGALSCALAHAELSAHAATLEAAARLRDRAAELARRAKAGEEKGTGADAPVSGGETGDSRVDEIALQGFAHGLRKIDQGLRALGR
jgi:uncharacterized membrane protein YccC